MARGQHLELLFHQSSRRLRPWQRGRPRTSLKDFLMGTTNWPGTQCPAGRSGGCTRTGGACLDKYMHPIAIGTYSYQIIATVKDFMALLEKRKGQAVLAEGRVMTMEDATGQYAPARLVYKTRPDGKGGKEKYGEPRWEYHPHRFRPLEKSDGTLTTPETQDDVIEEAYREARERRVRPWRARAHHEDLVSDLPEDREPGDAAESSEHAGPGGDAGDGRQLHRYGARRSGGRRPSRHMKTLVRRAPASSILPSSEVLDTGHRRCPHHFNAPIFSTKDDGR